MLKCGILHITAATRLRCASSKLTPVGRQLRVAAGRYMKLHIKGEKMNTLPKIKILSLFLFATSLFVFLSCGIFDSEELKPIEGNIIFSVQEGYRDHSSISEPSIMLSMVTEKIYPCCNWSIISEITVQSYKISIDFFGIYVPEICLTALGPAQSTSFLDISEGEYSLYFSYGGVTDRYVLTVTDSSIKISGNVSQFTKPKFKLFWRYPPNSFVYLCGTTTETLWICEDFLDTLLSEINLGEFQFPDSGEIPYPRSSDGHYYDMPAKYFFYIKDEDFDKAGEILKSYTQNVIAQYSGIGISLISWKNKKYLSWLFDS